MPGNKAKPDAGAHLERTGVKRISLEGRSVIAAMCVGQLGSLLPHVVVPSVLAAFLIPEWHLTGAQAGLLAGSGAASNMLTVCFLLRPVTPKPAQGRLLDFAPVFRNTHAMRFMLGYGALDAAGGPSNASAWTAAFSVLAAGILLGPVALYWSRRVTAQP
jgi:hypothetical protein